MRILKSNTNAVALLHTNRRRRQPQRIARLVRTEVLHGHADQLGREHPEAGANSGCDLIARNRALSNCGAAVELGDFEADMDLIGIAIAIEVAALHYSIGRQSAAQQGFL